MRNCMSWIDEVAASYKRGNQVLFAKDAELLEELQDLLAHQERKVVTLWALDFADETAAQLHVLYPRDARPQEAVDAARAWATGAITMQPARQKILACHACAKEWDSQEAIALCHAVGQACSVVHTVKHALGYPLYDLTALVRHYGIDACIPYVEARTQDYSERLLYWREHVRDYQGSWASFLR